MSSFLWTHAIYTLYQDFWAKQEDNIIKLLCMKLLKHQISIFLLLKPWTTTRFCSKSIHQSNSCQSDYYRSRQDHIGFPLQSNCSSKILNNVRRACIKICQFSYIEIVQYFGSMYSFSMNISRSKSCCEYAQWKSTNQNPSWVLTLGRSRSRFTTRHRVELWLQLTENLE